MANIWFHIAKSLSLHSFSTAERFARSAREPPTPAPSPALLVLTLPQLERAAGAAAARRALAAAEALHHAAEAGTDEDAAEEALLGWDPEPLLSQYGMLLGAWGRGNCSGDDGAGVFAYGADCAAEAWAAERLLRGGGMLGSAVKG